MASFDPMAGSQIDVDPALKPKDADVAKKRAELIQKFLNAGATQEQAEAEADRLMANNPVIFGLQAPAQAPAPTPAAPQSPQQSMEADLYAQGYSADEARKQAQMQAEMRAERERKQLEQDLSQSGYGQRRAPGPRTVDGRPVAQGAPFQSVEEAEGYYSREEGGTPGGYQPSQYDREMENRGQVMRYNEHGELGFSTIASDDPAALNVPYGVPGAPGRLGSRDALGEAGWSMETRDTPSGPRRVWVPEQNHQFVNGQWVPVAPEGGRIARMDQVADGPTKPPRVGAKDRANDFQAERRLYRMAARAGISPEEMRKRAPAAFGDLATGAGSLRPGADARQVVESARAAGEAGRQASFTRTMQARHNPMEYLGRGDINQWQQFVAAEQMLGGGGGFEVSVDPKTGERRVRVQRGMDPNQVQATNNQQLLDLGRRVGMNPELFNNQAGMQGQQWNALQRERAVARANELAKKRGGKLKEKDRADIARKVEAEFPGHGQAASDALDYDEPLPLPEGHGDWGRMPDGTFPGM
jgi:hypothetical protein